MNTRFRLRCESALTHPVTVGAVVVLLVNDVLLKALWPHPWTTGKLSDLAWVIFASPLLAFLLSFVTRGNRRAERAALVAAYVALPALYAAFNTFQPVHDWILLVLSLAGGSGVGSPIDPADSVVIPVGLGVAWWVWRRRPAGPHSLRVRLGLLTAAVAGLATVATSPPPKDIPVHGITSVGTSGDVVVAQAGLGLWVTRNGGSTWTSGIDEVEYETIAWGGQSVETPRGTYSIDGPNITRTFDGELETAYSAAYLQRKPNVWAQERDTVDLRRGNYTTTGITTAPWSVTFDSSSGNVIVAMGLQGIVIGEEDGRWTQVAIGPYSPTDFSFSGKLRRLASAEGITAALVLSLAFTAAALALGHSPRKRSLGELAVVRRAALRHRLRRSATRGLAAAVFAAIPSFLILPPTTARYSVFAPNPSFLEYWLPIVLFVSLPVVTAAVVGYWPRRGDQMAVTASFAGMLLLIALVLVLWLQGDVVAGAAKTAVVVLLALVAFMLLRYLRRGRSGQSASGASTDGE